MSSGFILMDEPPADHRVDNRYRVLVRLRSRLKIALCKFTVDLFNIGSILRSMTHIALSARFRLSGAFTSLRTICQSLENL